MKVIAVVDTMTALAHTAPVADLRGEFDGTIAEVAGIPWGPIGKGSGRSRSVVLDWQCVTLPVGERVVIVPQTTKRPAMAGETAPALARSAAGAGRSNPEQRAASGKAARARAPLEAQADFRPASSRDPVALLLSQAKTRVPELVAIRHGRMLVSPFTFYRGAALLMAADLHTTPTSGLRTQLCGDAHLSNFGAYASPERRLVFDINDFDETLPGPFDWDVKRLAASFFIAGQDNGFGKKHCRNITLTATGSYRTAMRAFAAQSILEVWYARLDIEDAFAEFKATLSGRQVKKSEADLKAAENLSAKARTRDAMQAIGKLTTMASGRQRIVSDPPLIVPIDELPGFDRDKLFSQLDDVVAAYRGTLQSDRRRLMDHVALADVAHKVVGVGSVGLRAWILLLEGGLEAEALLLQAKQAEASALADYAGQSEYVNQGERVVSGQRLMQAASDICLGWVRAQSPDGRDEDYYLRQLRDWKMSAEIETMGPQSMQIYARLCGWTLARAHARSGDRIAIAAYLGNSTKFDNAIADFADAYAEQNEKDHAALASAVATGRVEAQSGV
jgi:uncharacterized protein (DUF2252 family)